MKQIYEFNFDDGDDNSSGVLLVAATSKKAAMNLMGSRHDTEDWFFWKKHKNIAYTGRSKKDALIILKTCTRGGDHGIFLG